MLSCFLDSCVVSLKQSDCANHNCFMIFQDLSPSWMPSSGVTVPGPQWPPLRGMGLKGGTLCWGGAEGKWRLLLKKSLVSIYICCKVSSSDLKV